MGLNGILGLSSLGRFVLGKPHSGGIAPPVVTENEVTVVAPYLITSVTAPLLTNTVIAPELVTVVVAPAL